MSPPPTPGTNCTDAPEMALSTLYTYDSAPASLTFQWYHWTVAPGTYHITGHTLAVSPFLIGVIYTGPDCASLGSGTNMFTDCVTITVPSGGSIFLSVRTFTSTPINYTFIIEPGPC